MQDGKAQEQHSGCAHFRNSYIIYNGYYDCHASYGFLATVQAKKEKG